MLAVFWVQIFLNLLFIDEPITNLWRGC